MFLQPASALTTTAAPAAPQALPERTRLEYFRSYQAVLGSGNWVLNLLWGSLAFFSSSFIPIVGGMVWTGYAYDCVEHLHVTRGKEMPDFDANRFSDYLTRGVFPFLVQLVLWCSLGACYILMYIGLAIIIGLAEAAGDENAVIVLATGIPLLLLLLSLLVIIPMILLAPLMLRLGLSQDLSIGFKLSWWGDFLRRMWPEIVLTTLFVLMTGFIITSFGCLVMIIGFYTGWVWVSLASAHLAWQLYDLYLARGGEQVPLKPRRLVPPPASPPGMYYVPPPSSPT
jgi:hypothetical protein